VRTSLIMFLQRAIVYVGKPRYTIRVISCTLRRWLEAAED
jgi:hypothetical protein